jgi:methyl-accepting chemotaxis protein
MENNNNPREVAEIVENALRNFNEGMAHREQLSIRIGRRTTQIIRFGMLSMLMLGLALFYLIFILTKDFSAITVHMDDMSGYMSNMNQNLTAVTKTLGRVDQAMGVLNNSVLVMPALSRSVDNMDMNLGALSSDLNSVVGHLEQMNGNVLSMAASMQILNNQFVDMNRTVGHMSGNVNQMAKPMKVFPFQ